MRRIVKDFASDVSLWWSESGGTLVFVIELTVAIVISNLVIGFLCALTDTPF